MHRHSIFIVQLSAPLSTLSKLKTYYLLPETDGIISIGRVLHICRTIRMKVLSDFSISKTNFLGFATCFCCIYCRSLLLNSSTKAEQDKNRRSGRNLHVDELNEMEENIALISFHSLARSGLGFRLFGQFIFDSIGFLLTSGGNPGHRKFFRRLATLPILTVHGQFSLLPPPIDIGQIQPKHNIIQSTQSITSETR